LPALSTATPEGLLKVAADPIPSADPFDPEPANVVTTPLGVTFLILLFAETYTLPILSTATALGLLKLAAKPVPSADPTDPEPANVVTTPLGVIFLIL
jgi:hypothetical protein